MMTNKTPRELQFEKALQKIAKWFDEFPDTGRYWDKEKTRPISYAGAWGRNGERDYMREVARKALVEKPGPPPIPTFTSGEGETVHSAHARPVPIGLRTPSIPMLLWCPECNIRHIDQGKFADKPHHTHACQACGHVWRPAIVPTVGVQFLPGFKDKEEALANPPLNEK